MISDTEKDRMAQKVRMAERGWYGFQLVLDLHGCNPEKFNRKDIDAYFKRICEITKMERCERFWFDDVGVSKEERQTEVHTMGTSAVQFILTSSIVIHTLSYLRSVYVDIFTCKAFDKAKAEKFTKDWFESRTVVSHWLTRTYTQ